MQDATSESVKFDILFYKHDFAESATETVENWTFSRHLLYTRCTAHRDP